MVCAPWDRPVPRADLPTCELSMVAVEPSAEVEVVVAAALKASPAPSNSPATMARTVAAPMRDTTRPERPTLESESVTNPLTGVSITARPSLLRQESETRRTSARSLSSRPTASATTKQPDSSALTSLGSTAGVLMRSSSGSGLFLLDPEVAASKPVSRLASMNEGGR